MTEPGQETKSGREDRSPVTTLGIGPGLGGNGDAPQEPAASGDADLDTGDAAESVATGVDVRAIAQLGLLCLAVFYTLYFARSLIIPLVLAVLLSFVLAPVVRAMRAFRVPAPLGAALIIVPLMLAVALGSYRLSSPAARWLERAPQDVRQLDSWLQELREPMENVRAATEEVENLARLDDSGEEPVEVRGPGLGDTLFNSALGALSGLVMMVIILYLLLASDGLFVRKLASLASDRRAKCRVMRIARRTERRVSAYLFTITCINVGLGVAVGLLTLLFGLPNPALWGTLAGVANFVPYLGGAATALVLALVSVTTKDGFWPVLLPPLCYVLLNATEAYFITPAILSRRFSLNIVAIFVGLLFWGWLWGPAGVLLAVPILATLKILSDQIPRLTVIGEFLGR